MIDIWTGDVGRQNQRQGSATWRGEEESNICHGVRFYWTLHEEQATVASDGAGMPSTAVNY